MTIIIQDSKENITFDEINQLTESVGWGIKFYQTEEKWQRVLSVSSYIAYIKHDNQLIAFARIVEDGIMCMFYDICIRPDYQRKKLGTLLMNHLIDKIKDKGYISIGAFTVKNNETVSEFYQTLGFETAGAVELTKHQRTFC